MAIGIMVYAGVNCKAAASASTRPQPVNNFFWPTISCILHDSTFVHVHGILNMKAYPIPSQGKSSSSTCMLSINHPQADPFN